jgi:hypothetical protein
MKMKSLRIASTAVLQLALARCGHSEVETA